MLSWAGVIVRCMSSMQAHGAGEPADLKNGDVLLFGSDSHVRVSVTPSSDESTTVEQHLRLECEMLMQRVRVKSCMAHTRQFPCQTRRFLRMQRVQLSSCVASFPTEVLCDVCLQAPVLANALAQSHKG